MARQSIPITNWVNHMDLASVREGDEVYGTLSVPLAAEVAARGARYFHLVLELSEAIRGTELSAGQIERLGARFKEFTVRVAL
ncbi:CRISPR-associated protein Csx16 [Marinobacter sp. B9-2]|nr:CRISPR-associated protein Csx16 [Marinobacter sp. B9-2]